MRNDHGFAMSRSNWKVVLAALISVAAVWMFLPGSVFTATGLISVATLILLRYS